MLDVLHISEALTTVKKPQIVVFGDFCLDKYLYIDASRDEPSLETGKIAFQITHQKLYAGAAGTVTNNLLALGAKVVCVGLVGEDGEGTDLLRCLKKAGADTSYMVVTSDRNTCTYMKPMHYRPNSLPSEEGNRLDIRNFTPTPRNLEEKLLENLSTVLPNVDAVVICDQFIEADCSVITSFVRQSLAKMAKKYPAIPFLADSRGFIDQFSDMLVKCNDKELASIFNLSPNTLTEAEIPIYAQKLSQRTMKPVFITLGPQGVLFSDGQDSEFIRGYTVPGPLDICGAGDAWNAGTLFALTKRLDFVSAALVGNTASSLVIQQLGITGTTSVDAITERLTKWPNI
ncbi:MAG: PfkB family carbohydrate kinase [Planctomycetia bacterium]|nr:PfkB family carbohydrate kinase [Planctomycetia bacterium]